MLSTAKSAETSPLQFKNRLTEESRLKVEEIDNQLSKRDVRFSLTLISQSLASSSTALFISYNKKNIIRIDQRIQYLQRFVTGLLFFKFGTRYPWKCILTWVTCYDSSTLLLHISYVTALLEKNLLHFGQCPVSAGPISVKTCFWKLL